MTNTENQTSKFFEDKIRALVSINSLTREKSEFSGIQTYLMKCQQMRKRKGSSIGDEEAMKLAENIRDNKIVTELNLRGTTTICLLFYFF